METESNDVIGKAMSFPMGSVLDKYMLIYNVPLEEARKHEVELKRFLALCALGDGQVRYGIGKPIDDLWHELILSTRLYTKFCEQVAGKYIHHKARLPGASRAAADVAAMNAQFRVDYKKAFGEEASEAYWSVMPECSHVSQIDTDRS